MSSEVEQRQSLAINPATGEQIDLAGPDEELCRALFEIRHMEGLVRDLKAEINQELLRRFDRDAQWTIHLPGGMTASAPSSEPVEEYDELALREDLLKLADAGVITIEAVDRAIEPVVTYKARKAGLNALRKLGGVIARLIDEHTRRVPRRRYVRIDVG